MCENFPSHAQYEEALQAIALDAHARFPESHHVHPGCLDEAIGAGQGWIAEEALAISIYCSLVAQDFRHGVLMAVNHDGDSDSTGAITGNLLGATLGVKSMPEEWLAPLELRAVISEFAEDLYAFKDWDIGEYGRNIRRATTTQQETQTCIMME